MPPKALANLSRRERQIMDILFERGERSAQEVMDEMPDPPSYSAVRALIARLVESELVIYRLSGKKYIYAANIEESKAQTSAISRLLKTFFRGSRASAVSALLDMDGDTMTALEIEQIQRTINKIKKNKKIESGDDH